jgi:peptide/nickel transport system permease protein
VRISPVKFGTRDQRSAAGEIITAPKPLPPPVGWRWFVEELPPTPRPDFAFAPEATGPSPEAAEQRARAHRLAMGAYASSRARFVALRAEFDRLAADVLRDHGHERHVRANGRLKTSATGLDAAPFRDELEAAAGDAGRAMIAAYTAAIADRAHLAAVFDARPYPQVGIGIPGVPVSLGPPDLGRSFSRSRQVTVLIGEALPRTLLLNFIAFPLIYLIAIPSGMLAAARRGSWFDVLSGGLFVALWSVPIVWAGVLAVGYLANERYLGWFPVKGLHSTASETMAFLPHTTPDGWSRGYLLDALWHVVLPVACLVYGGFAVLAKQTRAAMLDNFNADYVRTAKAKGVSPRDVTLRHVFRNSLLPLITMFVSVFPAMLAGSVVIEKIFGIEGMGSLVLGSITLGDRELLLATAFIIGLVNMLALLLADILYALADPRITYD